MHVLERVSHTKLLRIKKEIYRAVLHASVSMLLVSIIAPLGPWIAQAQAAPSSLSRLEDRKNYPGALQVKSSSYPSDQAQPVQDQSFRNGDADTVAGEPIFGAKHEKSPITPHELTEKRTATSSTRINADGSYTQTNYVTPHFYKNGSSWNEINTNLVEDKNSGDSTNIFGRALGQVSSKVDDESGYGSLIRTWAN